MPPRKNLNIIQGFTLAELLISLAILGVIATFAIPKIISNLRNESYRSEAKEVAANISHLYVQEYMQNGGDSWASAASSNLYYIVINNMNHTSRITSSEQMTYPPGGSSTVFNGDNNCIPNPAWVSCWKLHNGGVLWIPTLSTWYNPLEFYFDPDGSGPEQSVGFRLYSRTSGSMRAGRVVSLSQLSTGATPAPNWFSW